MVKKSNNFSNANSWPFREMLTKEVSEERTRKSGMKEAEATEKSSPSVVWGGGGGGGVAGLGGGVLFGCVFMWGWLFVCCDRAGEGVCGGGCWGGVFVSHPTTPLSLPPDSLLSGH